MEIQGIQLWTVPKSGKYRIEAFGAGGGGWSSSYTVKEDQQGAQIRGDFELIQGEKIRILVGQRGYRSGGGDGTFVVRNLDDTISSALIIAGGGGGIDSWTSLGSHSKGSVSTSGQDYPGYSNSGGDNGYAGESKSGHSSGGAGFLGDSQYSKSFINGGATNSSGGFGGGGYGCHCGGYPGRGGGFSGGAAAVVRSQYSGGGGGSYNTGTNQNNIAGGNTEDHGESCNNFYFLNY